MADAVTATVNTGEKNAKAVPTPKPLGGFYTIDGKWLGNGNIIGDIAYLTTDAIVSKYVENALTQWVNVVGDVETKNLGKNSELVKLAAASYGEGSTGNVYEEMAGISNVLVNQSKARATTIAKLLKPGGTFAYAVSDGNQRYKSFFNTLPDQRNDTPGFVGAIKGAINAITGGTDYSNGGYFWDGVDIKTNYSKHPKILMGYFIADSSHNVNDIKSNILPEATEYIKDKNGVNTTKVRGKYTYAYETTAGKGKTMFATISDAYVKAMGCKKYK